jgi:threonine/homoserine/homoserine lactone efflux protein
MSMDLWAAFALACLLLAVVPGPGVATILGFAIGSGRRTALAAVAGMALGNAIAISASLAGAGAILAASALAFTMLKWLGALYLIAMGVLAIRRAGRAAEEEAVAPAVGARAAFLTTVAVGVFHPKTILFFMAFASQFVTHDSPFLPQAAIMVATFTAIAATTDALYAVLGARAAERMRSATARRWAGRAGGGVLILAGAATAAMRR